MSLISDKYHKEKLKEYGINIKTKYIVDNKILERNTDDSINDDIIKGIRCGKEYYLKNKLRVLINKIPAYNDFIEYTFILLLSIIIRSGVNLSEGLIYASNSFKNKDLKERFSYLNSGILNGDSISITLGKTGNYSKYTLSIVKLGEEGGAIDERLNSLSLYLEKKLLSNINRGIALLQPASVIFMGGFVIIFLIIFILPLFSAMYEVGF